MKSNIAPLEPEKVYHIYNRGNNGDDIFFRRSDAQIFLDRYFEYTNTVLDTYCYCLLKNHFHFLVKIKTEEAIRKSFAYKSHKSVSEIISKQFSHFFNSYAQTIKNKYGRTGGLFEPPFRRIWVDSDAYFTEMVYYIHNNPEKHGFVTDFKEYPYSSYSIYTDNLLTKNIHTSEVLDWFGGAEGFKQYHLERQQHGKDTDNDYTFEID
jgi:putative transposase